jgi:hypothetical protein
MGFQLGVILIEPFSSKQSFLFAKWRIRMTRRYKKSSCDKRRNFNIFNQFIHSIKLMVNLNCKNFLFVK